MFGDAEYLALHSPDAKGGPETVFVEQKLEKQRDNSTTKAGTSP